VTSISGQNRQEMGQNEDDRARGDEDEDSVCGN